jgi:hypothetical protein
LPLGPGRAWSIAFCVLRAPMILPARRQDSGVILRKKRRVPRVFSIITGRLGGVKISVIEFA